VLLSENKGHHQQNHDQAKQNPHPADKHSKSLSVHRLMIDLIRTPDSDPKSI
jgi:hypothetical protein